MTDFQIDEIARVVEPNDAQRASLDELRTAMAQALDILKAACPTSSRHSDRTHRSDAGAARRDVGGGTHRARTAGAIQRAAQRSAEGSLQIPSAKRMSKTTRRRGASPTSLQRARRRNSRASDEQIERAVRPDETQRGALADLRNAISQAGELLKSNCPTYQPSHSVVRLEAMEQRLDAMLRAVEAVRPALMNFYG